MTKSELIELAKAYVALSNAHRADLIESLFDAGAVYRSGAVGEHRGRTAIIDMMRGFFNDYPDVHWQVGDYACEHNRVEFDFSLHARSIERSGREYITFDASGFIIEIEVIIR